MITLPNEAHPTVRSSTALTALRKMNSPFASGAWPSPTTLTESGFSSPVAMINPRDSAHSKIWPIVSPQNEQELLVQGLVRTRFWGSSSETSQRTPSVTGRKANPDELEIRRGPGKSESAGRG